MIKFGYSMTWHWVSFFGADFHKFLDEISLSGWDGIEMNNDFLNYYLDHVDKLKKILKLHNLELITFYSHLALTDKNSIEAEINLVKRKIDLIKNLGADILLLDGGKKDPEGNTEKDYRFALGNIKKICELANSSNVKPTWHLHWGTMFDKEKYLDYLMEKTEKEGLYFCPDTAQLTICGMDPLNVMKKYKNRISYIHFKDIVENNFINRYLKVNEEIDPKNNTLVPLSSAGEYKYLENRYLDNGAFHINSKYRIIEVARGQIDFKPMVRLIKDIGFNGWVTVDQDYTGYMSAESLDVNLRNLKYLFEEN